MSIFSMVKSWLGEGTIVLTVMLDFERASRNAAILVWIDVKVLRKLVKHSQFWLHFFKF